MCLSRDRQQFCVNSLAHTLGEQTYSTQHTSYDHIITALVTFGEGYHNFHHEFPHEYRNGIQWYHYDPTKWMIKGLSLVGLCSGLTTMPENEISKARVQVRQQQLDKIKATIDWGQDISKLSAMSWSTVNARVADGEKLVIIEGIVHKVDEFVSVHPGGTKILEFWNGRDATRAFNGEVYRHSKGARNLLSHMRIAKLDEQLE